MTSGVKHRQAMVLSGGGANGAYEVGVLKALLTGQSPATEFQPLDPDIFTGTSVGAFNAALLVSLWETHGQASISNLETTCWHAKAGEMRRTAVIASWQIRWSSSIQEIFSPILWPLSLDWQTTASISFGTFSIALCMW
jgi:hypothetical protein